MNTRLLLSATLACSLLCAPLASAQENGTWRASSTTARGITGDVAFSGSKFYINFAAFTVAQLRTLTGPEAHTVFNADPAATGTGNLYTLNIPASKQFLHHNTLCGSDDTQYMATYVTGRTLQIAFFSGARMPTLTPEALADTTNLCGAFTYVR